MPSRFIIVPLTRTTHRWVHIQIRGEHVLRKLHVRGPQDEEHGCRELRLIWLLIKGVPRSP